MDLVLATGMLAHVHVADPNGGWEPEPARYFTEGTSFRLADLSADGKPEIISWGGSNAVGFLIHR